MIKSQKAINSFSKGVDSDSSVNKVSNDTYYDATNFRIISNDPSSSGALETVKGNVLKLQFGNNEVIIGHCKIRNSFNDTDKDSIVFFTRNSVAPNRCRIYLLEGDPGRISGTITMNQTYQTVAIAVPYKCGYIYEDNAGDMLNFSESYPIKAEGRYESSGIRKVYWVDGYNNIRYMILDALITSGFAAVPTTAFEINPSATLLAPTATVDSGGGYKSGVVQYSYQLYIKNGARTTFAPVSHTLTLSGGDSSSSSSDNVGTILGANTGKSCIVTIPSVDTDFNRIRIVAIYYTELNINPVINVVGEFAYESTATNLTFVDTGTEIYDTIPLEEFRILGQTDYKADSLATKNNYMFYANTTKSRWNPNFLNPAHADFWDARAVRFRHWHATGTATTAAVGARHGSSSVTFDKGTNDKRVVVTIPSWATYVSIPAGRTVNSITAIATTRTDTDAVNGTWHTAASAPVTYSSIGTETTFSYVSYIAGDLIMHVDTSGADYFDATYDHMPTIIEAFNDVFDVVFTYTYTETTATVNAIVEDVAGNITIDQPAGNSIAQWDTAHWDTYEAAYNHDGINIFNDIDNDDDVEHEYKYQYDGATLGASGKNIKIEFPAEEELMIDTNTEEERVHVNTPFSATAADTYKRSSMRNEVYRLYLVFYNTKMQFSNPQWICDLRMPSVPESSFLHLDTQIYARYIYPKITLYNLPTDPDFLGWQVFRCERKNADRSILMRGLVSTVFDDTVHVRSYTSDTSPYVFIRAEDIDTYVNVTDIVEFIAPEITFNKNINRIAGDKIRIEGRYSYDVATSNPSIGGEQYLYWMKTKEVTAPSATDTKVYGISDLSIFSDSQFNATSTSYTYSIIGGEQFQHNVSHEIGGDAHYGKIGTKAVLALDANITVDDATTGYIQAAYMRNIHNSRYGGITYEARSYNQVIPFSSYVDHNVNNTTCYYGDTFIHFYTYLQAMFFDGAVKRFQTVVNVATETTIDLFHRLDPIQKYIDPIFSNAVNPTAIYGINEKFTDGVNSYPSTYPIELGDLYRQNAVYSQCGNAQLIQCKVFDSNEIETFDTEIISTAVKTNNEYFDNWTNVLTNNTLWLDSKYGAIRNIWTLNNTLFAGQDKAVAQVSVQERSMIQDNTKLGLVLGTGDVLSRYDYLTTASGIQNYFDVCISDKSFYYIDRRNKIIYQMTGQGDVPLSEVNGLRSLLKSYGAITTVKSGYDPVYKDVFFYITDGTISNTLTFNEYIGSFTGKQTFTPSRMFGLNENFYSITANQAWIHNGGSYGEFYGVLSDSDLSVVINPNKEVVNSYDVLDLRVDVTSGATYYDTEQFNHITVSNSNPNQTFTKTLSFTGADTDTTKGIVRKWRIWLIPDDLSTDFFRMKDTFVKVKLVRHNTGNKKLTVHDLNTYFRPTRN